MSASKQQVDMSPKLSTPTQGMLTSNARTDEYMGHVATQHPLAMRR